MTERTNDARRVVDCAEHGQRDAAFVCQHLPTGERAGFNWGIDDENPDGLWPDA